MTRPDIVLERKRTYVPLMFRKKKDKDKEAINCTFAPLICMEMYDQWIKSEIEVFEQSQKYVKVKDEYITFKNSSEEDKKNFTEVAEQLQKLVNNSRDISFRFIETIILSNENPKEYTLPWIKTVFTADDVGEFIRTVIMGSDDEIKKKMDKI